MKAGIVGGGIMGQLLALSLLNQQWETTIFDFNNYRNCSETAAGLLAPIIELEKNARLVFDLGIEALNEGWPNVLNFFKNKIFFRKEGSLMVAHPQDHVELKRKMTFIAEKLRDDHFYKKMTQQEIALMEPILSKFHQGYYFCEEGQIDNQQLLVELKKSLLEKNVIWFADGLVEKIKPGKIFYKNEYYSFDMVFDCRGLGAKKNVMPLRGVRGELIWLHAPQVNLTRPVHLVHPRAPLYIVPRPGHVYILGASEVELEDYGPISLHTTLELLTAAYSITSSFAEARVIKTMTHCRPAFSNHLPKIKYCDGYLAINGLYRYGFLIVPSLVSEINRWSKHGIAGLKYPTLWEKTDGYHFTE